MRWQYRINEKDHRVERLDEDGSWKNSRCLSFSDLARLKWLQTEARFADISVREMYLIARDKLIDRGLIDE